MATKTVFLVLLAVILVSVKSKALDEQSIEHNIKNEWNELGDKLSHAVSHITSAWNEVKEEGTEIWSKLNFRVIKEKSDELLSKVEDLTYEVESQGEEILPKLMKIKDSAKELANELKEDGSEALHEGKKLIRDVLKEIEIKVITLREKAKINTI